MLAVRYFSGSDCDTDQYVVVAKFREGLAVINKQHRRFKWKDLISGSFMSWRLGNSIRFRSQTNLQLFRM
jgi:hypothetical protein